MRKRKKRDPKDEPLPNLSAAQHGYLGACDEYPARLYRPDGQLWNEHKEKLEEIGKLAAGVSQGRSPDDQRERRGYLERLSPDFLANYSAPYDSFTV